MNYSSLKYISPATQNDLSRGYIYTNADMTYLTSGSTNGFPFGSSEFDAVEVSIMSVDGAKMAESFITSSATYTPYARSFIDVNNVEISYSCSLFRSDFVLVGDQTRSLFLDGAQLFADVGISQGTYLLGIDPVRYLVGSPWETTRSLVVREISPSGKEALISPTTMPEDTDDKSVQFNVNYSSFTLGKVLTKQVVGPLLSGIETPSIYNAYYEVYNANSGSAEFVKNWYSFIGDIDWTSVNSGAKSINYQDSRMSDIAVIQFITDIYYGVKRGSLRSNGQVSNQDIYGIYDQFKNSMFQNYETSTTFEEIRGLYYSLFVYILDRELNRITNTKPTNIEEVVGFFGKILYDVIFSPTIDKLEAQYSDLLTGYLKNYACFSTDVQLPILNYTSSVRMDAAGNNMLLLKFAEKIPLDVKVGSMFWITNKMVAESVIQRVYLYNNGVVETVKLRGPNFLIGVESIGNGTENTSLEDAVGVTGSLYDEIVSKLDAKNAASVVLNVDYRYFENFIKFSSATSRLSIFTSKRDSILECESQLLELDVKLLINPNDASYISDKKNVNDSINSIEASMDGYELFLYNNPAWYDAHTEVFNGMTSGSLYDRSNVMSLVSSLPSYVRENEDNSDYVTFVNMVGHYFDNLSSYITQFTQKNDASNSTNTGISDSVVFSMLSSLGWEPESGKENLPLLLSSFSKADFDVSSSLWNMVGTMSETERNQSIWKRLLNNLSYIFKTKGTENSINALVNCYSIPRNLLSIREYGGIENSYNVTQDSIYSFDETKYAMSFTGNGEYLQLPWTGSIQSVEFSVAFDANRISDVGQVFRLINCSDNWVVGFIREKGQDWGRIFFTIQDGSGSLLTTTTQRAPIFGGDVFTILLRKENIHPDFALSPYYTASLSDQYPHKYEILAVRSDESRNTFAVSSSILLSGSYNSQWKQGSSLYVGNYQQNTSSLMIDPEAFFGTIDEIKTWEMPVDMDRYSNHASYQGAYDANEPTDVVNKSIVRVSFGYPIDLYSDSGSVQVYNAAFRPDYPTIQAVNFPPSTGSVQYDPECSTEMCIAGFPFQFKSYNINQSVNLPNFGSNKFRSNKVNFVSPVLVSSLSSDSRSTLQGSVTNTVDSNKLGVFFSPTDMINAEMMKFFGKYEFGDLIGNPQDVYKKTYPNFEVFRKLYFDQGGGQMDYQTYMNMIRSYFDKSLFTYIQSLTPARTKTVSGLMIEPSILERPKIQQKAMRQEVHRNVGTAIDAGSGKPIGTYINQLTQSLDIKVRGDALYDDYNRSFYNDRLDPFGFGIYADNGIAYYRDDFWRVDVVPIKKTVIVESKKRKPLSQTTEVDVVDTDRGRYQIISQSYESVNISQFPVLSQYPIEPTMVLGTGTVFTTFNGKIQFKSSTGTITGTPPNQVYVVTMSAASGSNITMDGLVTSTYVVSGSLTGKINGELGVFGNVNYPNQIMFSGSYNNTTQVFNGIVTLVPGATVSAYFYTPVKQSSIFDEFRDHTNGSLFTSILSTSYKYRRDLSLKNIPIGSRPLNGYYFTHYRFKRPVFSRRTVQIVDNNGSFAGTFRRGSQNQKTTVQLDGLFDNSPPIVITKSV